MINQQIPAEYAWIKPGAWGEHPMLSNPVEFTSTPFLSNEFAPWRVWAAETKNGPAKVIGFVQVDPPKDTAEQTLAKARAVLAEQKQQLDRARRHIDRCGMEHGDIWAVLAVSLADALEGGGDE